MKMDMYTYDCIGQVVQLHAMVEGMKLAQGLVDRLVVEGQKSLLFMHIGVSLYFDSRYAFQLLIPVLLLGQMGGGTQIELEDIKYCAIPNSLQKV